MIVDGQCEQSRRTMAELFVACTGNLEPEPAIMNETEAFDSRDVECPYCGESVELVLEADIAGELVVDCEVCCRPWRVRVRRGGGEMTAEVRREDD